MKLKSEVFECFVHFTRRAGRETGKKVVNLRSDNGGDYITLWMQEWCCLEGIRQTMGPPHTPKLNGVSKSYNRTLLDRLKPSLKNSSLHQEFL